MNAEVAFLEYIVSLILETVNLDLKKKMFSETFFQLCVAVGFLSKNRKCVFFV